jgi:hypothetical protein
MLRLRIYPDERDGKAQVDGGRGRKEEQGKGLS